MTNKEYINFHKVLGHKVYLSRNELNKVIKSRINLHEVMNRLSKELRGTDKNWLDEVLWRGSYNLIKLCERHNIGNDKIEYLIENISKLHNKKQELYKTIDCINLRSFLDIDFNMFKICKSNSYNLMLEHKEWTFDEWKNVGLPLKNKEYKILAYIERNGDDRIYTREDSLVALLNEIFKFDYEKVHLANFKLSDIDIIDKALPSNISVGNYLKIIVYLRFLNLSMSINLHKLEKFRKTKKNMRGLIKTVVKLIDTTDYVKLKFLIKVEELSRDDNEIEKLNLALEMFTRRIRLKRYRLSEILSSEWDTLPKLITSLRVIDFEKVHMITELEEANHYYLVNSIGTKVNLSVHEDNKRYKISVNDNILVGADRTCIDVNLSEGLKNNDIVIISTPRLKDYQEIMERKLAIIEKRKSIGH